MAEITAAIVKELRERTGQAMMDCKKALQETNGDMEKAVDLLRKKGMAVMEKRAGRETKEGNLVGKISGDKKIAVLTMLCCETDFTSKSSEFQAASQALADALLQAKGAAMTSEAIAELAAGDGKTVGFIVNEIISKTGEKVQIGECAKFELQGAGLLHCYVHFNGKIGTLIQLETDSDKTSEADAVKTLASDIAMHVTAVNPVAVNREQVDPSLVEREREVAREQVKGKPENIINGIIEGKLKKWYQQIVLLEQPFVKDDSVTVQQLIDQISKQVGGTITMKSFARLQIG